MNTCSHFRLASAALALWFPALASLSAEQFGLFTYRVDPGDQVTITDYPEDAVGHVEIPATIEGKPVTALSTPVPRTGPGHGGRTPPPEYTFSPGAFANCRGITSISIPGEITRIGSGTFFNCAGLQHLELPADLTELGGHSFAGSGVTTLLIPATVVSISEYAFSDCPALTSIHVEPRNAAYRSIDGVLFDITATTLLQYPEGRAGPYVVPPGTTAIRNYFTLGRRIMQHGAFFNCTRLTSITLPAGTAFNRWTTFSGCSALTSIHIEPGHPEFASEDGVLFNTDKTTLLHYPQGRPGAYTVPVGVTTIGGGAFWRCNGLTSVTIPEGVSSIDHSAFSGCTDLTAAIFLGAAPSLSETTFSDTAPDFTIYYLSTSTGFTSPTWNGYPTVEIDVDHFPAAPWLLELGLSHDTDLHQDLNHDGVSLLMAYALDLDPHQDLRSSLPVPVIDGDSLRVTFPAPRVNLTYTAQTSTDLQNWTTEGVTTSELDPSGIRTATVPRDTPQRFLRLVVE